ncbi:MAG: cell division protein SepF [Lachnospiraceae bacterium]
MGAMSNITSLFDKIRYGSEDYYEEDYLDDEEPIEDPKAIRKTSISDTDLKNKSSKVTPITRKRSNIGGMEVYGCRPSSMEDAKEITDTLIDNRTVVLNLEGLDNSVANRILDFTMGTAYALNAHIQKISNGIFIIAPETVDISGAFTEIMND